MQTYDEAVPGESQHPPFRLCVGNLLALDDALLL